MFNLRLEAACVADGWMLTPMVSGAFVWGGELHWGGLPAGDVHGPVGDDNPAAVWAALIGRVSAAMAHLGVTDTDPSPLVYAGVTTDPGVVCAFQEVCLAAAGSLLEIGYRKAAKHGSRRPPGEGEHAWAKAPAGKNW